MGLGLGLGLGSRVRAARLLVERVDAAVLYPFVTVAVSEEEHLVPRVGLGLGPGLGLGSWLGLGLGLGFGLGLGLVSYRCRSFSSFCASWKRRRQAFLKLTSS